jgi:predicted Zn-dependent protease
MGHAMTTAIEPASDGPRLADALERTGTLAEVQGITRQMGEVIAALAEAELDAGRLEAARIILEGLVATNHLDAGAWALLSRTQRRLLHPLAARFCAEVAARLAPEDPAVRMVRAEALLLIPGERDRARCELERLAPDPQVGPRARALLTALGG